MAKIFITGSSDGLGLLAAQELIRRGHRLVLHARNSERARQLAGIVKDADSILTGDLSDIEETNALAEKVNAAGDFDVIIHNAGVYRDSDLRIFAVNSLAPYILTCLIRKPKRMIYLSSGMHFQGNPEIKSLHPETGASYSDSKLHVLWVSMAVARNWRDVISNAIHPGWVPTKMGGANAPDDLRKGYETQVWLAESNDQEALKSGRYFSHNVPAPCLPIAMDTDMQDKFINKCAEITGIPFPA